MQQREIECHFLVLHKMDGKFYHSAPGEVFTAWIPKGWNFDACMACVEMGNTEKRIVCIVPFQWSNPHALSRKLYRTYAIRPGTVLVPAEFISKL